MAKGENIIQASRDSDRAGHIPIKDKAIPYKVLRHPIISPLIDGQAKDFVSETEYALKNDQMIEATVKTLSQEQSLGNVDSINILPVQMGRKAFIILCQMMSKQGSEYFALHIGRNPNGSEMGNEAERDYYNLLNLSETADRRLNDKAKRKYKFLKPTTLYSPIEIDGNQYSAFSMPFIDDYGELRVNLLERGPKFAANRIPFFRYSVDFSKRMTDYNDATIKRTERLMDKLYHLRSRLAGKSPDYVGRQFYRLPEAKIVTQQLEELLVGNALVYLLSDGHFPKEFVVNAGDWMVNFVGDALNLYLITVRGGWEYLGDDQAWIKKMSEHHEPVPGREKEAVAFPLFYDMEELITNALLKAKRLLKE